MDGITTLRFLEDVFEALIGAIYMDIGLIHAKEFILRIYQDPEICGYEFYYGGWQLQRSSHAPLPGSEWVAPSRISCSCAHYEGLFYIDIFIDNDGSYE